MTKKTHDEKPEELEDSAKQNSVDESLEEKSKGSIEEKEDEQSEEDKIDWEEKYKRALADYQNLEKRSHDQRREWIVSSNRELLLRIFPVLDTLILAQKHSEDKNLEISVKQFLDVLKSEGVTKIDALGKDFDPHIMEAVATEDGEEGKVTSEVQTGYLMNDKLLRPALVKVGKKEKSEE